MNELSLYTGIGGGLLGSKLLGWRTIGAVEWEKYCCQALERRIKDGCFEPFPIWNIDIREFNRKYAKQYRGMADIITAGFPCQPFSIAGKGEAEKDERNMWPATIECIRIVRPRYALLENVPGLITSGYFGEILRDLAESGYDCRWRCLSAAEVGANHKRNRLWILAYSEHNGQPTAEITGSPEARSGDSKAGQKPTSEPTGLRKQHEDVADADSSGQHPNQGQFGSSKTRDNTRRSGAEMVDSNDPRCNPGGSSLPSKRQEENPLPGDSDKSVERDNWWSTEPDLGRLAHGVPNRVDRLKAIGNGQVPICMAVAYELLSQEI